MSLEVFDRHTVMTCLEHYHGNTNCFISFMCMVPVDPCYNCCLVLSPNWIFKIPQCIHYCCITSKVFKKTTHCEVFPHPFRSPSHPWRSSGNGCASVNPGFTPIYKKCLLTKCCRSYSNVDLSENYIFLDWLFSFPKQEKTIFKTKFMEKERAQFS